MANVKTIGTSLFSWQNLAAAASPLISSVIDVSASGLSIADPASQVLFAPLIQIGRKDGSAFTAGWPSVLIQGSFAASGNAYWSTIVPWTMPVGALIMATTINGAVTAGATTITVTSSTNLVQSDLVFFGDSSAANYEICQIRSVSSNVITLFEACTNNHSNGAEATSQAIRYSPLIPVTHFNRIRVLIDVSNSGRDIRVTGQYNLFYI